MNTATLDLEKSPLGAAARSFLASPVRMVMGGEAADARSGRELEVFDPATGAVIARVPAAAAADVDKAVGAARLALAGEWSRLRPTDRERLILKLADLVEADGEALAEIETLNNGQSLGL